MNRRAYLKYMGFLALASCSSTAGPRSIKFGLGNDPEKMINAYDPDGRRVLETLKPDIVCTWLNGSRDPDGRICSPSIDYFREWAAKGRFAEWSRAGYELMVITWENYDGQNPLLGSPTFGEYHISAQFLEDLKELSGYLTQFSKKIYIALATEQSTYSACRYDRTCADPLAYSDRVNEVTREYFQPLRENLLRAVALLRRELPHAEVGLCFGGWLVKYPALWEFIHYFEPVIEAGNALFFQSMREKTVEEDEGYGNPEQILDNCRFFARWKKPLHLAHYMPNNKRADVVADDLLRMSEAAYLRELGRYLSSFSFMDYGLPKNNPYGSLERLKAFRQRLTAIP